MLRHQRQLIVAFAVALVAILLSAPSSSLAYITGIKWQTGGLLFFQIDPNLNANLGVADARAAISDAAYRWNQASDLTLWLEDGFDPNGPRRITTADFRDPNSIPCAHDDGMWSVVCVFPAALEPGDLNATHFDSSPMFLNVSSPDFGPPTIQWFTDGQVIPGPVRHADVYNLVLHEMGHWMELRDFPNGHQNDAVMWFDNRAKPDLAEDDKQGATMLHGPFTGWEDLDASGRTDALAYSANVSGYSAGLPPQLGPTDPATDQAGIPVQSGSKYARLAGTATAPNSFAYFKLFTQEDDANADFARRNYVTITRGMFLHWCQYNYQQDAMSVDFEMTDDFGNITTLRDSGLRDTNGVRVHPAARSGAYLANQ